ncbi:endonuclease [Pseudoalteromonas sp. KG3]|uniref:Endonuclease n=1 Tax=Pseudoalteromonas prydzensis TaxID=182141 RepID=A0ABR9FHV8_9GAMM|nr:MULTISPECIES: endonuclease [Pseudoalteromonas]MBE0456397.1 endonuclease [Pseudoalteromonas prydzensis]WKD22199.1 endonuclease [Pseudoalteromonas sp. KG3]
MSHGTYKKCILASAVLSAALPCLAAIDNGDFENWAGNTPNNWSTIDSGIVLSPSSSIVNSGSLAAKVEVNTASQSSTDLLQQVDVETGQSYQFSSWVYHTEGGVKARLIADGYQGYSNPALLNQWQQLSYTYTASSNTTISVGLRFYDVSGFDGSETVYVDSFMPNSAGNTQPTPDGCADNTVSLALTTDNYGEETSWQITNAQGTPVASGGGYSGNNSYTEQACLVDGDYTFSIFDSYGDGICCSFGNGSYALTSAQTQLASGSSFQSSEATPFTLGDGNNPETPPTEPSGYYVTTQGLTGYALKSELYNIIKDHNSQGYSAIWSFYDSASRDKYFENDNSILDRYAENPTAQDSYNYVAVADQCGTYRSEGDCYNREHSFPKSWFGGTNEPMNSDVHHIFATDGYVNSKRSNYPFGEVGSASYTSSNGSKLGSAASSINYSGTVFEPIDEFKGDFARAYFYMATRYENVIGSWQNNTTYSNAVLNGTSNQVFENWVVTMLVNWHNDDPVSQLELDRNQAAYEHQGNRNPYIDHPEFVEMIW